MLVILSDLHLTDGTSCDTLDVGAFRIFVERLQDLAVRASWRSDGTYRPITHFDILLMGDVLDIMRSSRWLLDGAKPWMSKPGPSFANRVQSVVNSVLDKNSETASIFKGIASRNTIRVPAMTEDGKPAFEHDLQPVEARIFYMVGDSDWPLHLAGPEMDLVRASICQAFGLTNPPNAIFPHEAHEYTDLQYVMRQHRVSARHGDIYDPLCFARHRDRAAFSNIFEVEGLMRFRFELQSRLGDKIPASTQTGIAELDHIRPCVMAPVWLRQMMRVTCPIHSLQFEIKNCWDETIERMMEIVYRTDCESHLGLKDLEGLRSLLQFQFQDGEAWGSKINDWMQKQSDRRSNSMSRFAMEEPDFRNRRAKHIVFGHSHQDELTPLDASYADGYLLNQTYFNSGTWRRVYMPAAAGIHEQQEFLPSERMTYLTYYRDEERQGAPYEVWNGVLGTASSPIRRVRVDSAQNVLQSKRGVGDQAPSAEKRLFAGGHSIPKPPPQSPVPTEASEVQPPIRSVPNRT